MRQDAPTICLNMIVRNEAHVIAEAFDSIGAFITTWVIVDTGSTDETREVIRAHFDARGLPGELHDRPWRDFGHNRTEALALARGKADYIWVLDADDLVVGAPDLSALTADCYHVRFGPDFVYWRPQIFRGTREWAYRGAVHEYAIGVGEYSQARLDGRYHVASRRLGDRNRVKDKYARDCRLLLDELAERPDDARAIFYLGQSYFDAGDAREALGWYTRRAELGGWDEEVFYATLQRAVCLDRLNEPWPVCQAAYLAAWEFRPTRAEPLVAVAARHRLDGRHHEAYLFARAATEIAWPDADSLFVAADAYHWRAADERSIAAYYTGRHEEALDLCTALLDSPHLPEHERDRVMSNRDFAVARILEHPPARPDAIIRNIHERLAANTAPPVVTLTMTACKRPRLFAETVDSFLACCQDLDRIGRWIVVDDGSTFEDRAWMADRYPFFEWIWKAPDEKGHARSMNAVLDTVASPYWLHLEDDWRFFVRDRYVTKALAILDDDATLGQVLFNRNYGETTDDRRIGGGRVGRTTREDLRYRVHDHAAPGSTEYDEALTRVPAGAPNVIYWPHYSLRPSVARMSAIRDVGPFEPSADHFEREFAVRYRDKGYRSAFLDAITCQHLGRLTSDRTPGGEANAYDLNNEPQFSPRATARPRRVKLTGSAVEGRGDRWRRQARAGGVWNDIVLTTEDQDADFVAILGEPGREPIEPHRTIVFPSAGIEIGDGPPGGSAPAALDARECIQVRRADRYGPAGVWRFDRDWETLASRPIDKTRRLSMLMPAESDSPGAAAARALAALLTAGPLGVDVHREGDVEGLLPYAYAIAVEAADTSPVTGAFFDALAAECLCFYSGAPDLDDDVDPAAFVRLPIDDPAAAARVIEDAIGRDLRRSRLPDITRARRRFLHDRQIVPTLARVIHGHEFVERLAIRVLNLDRRTDRWQRFDAHARETLGTRAARIERVTAVDGSTLTLTPAIRHTFRGNDFNFRRGIIGCALSHLALWKEAATGDRPYLIFEDDVRLAPDFVGQLTEVAGEIQHADADLVLLGYQAWTAEQRAAIAEARRPGLRPMDWSAYLGGCFGYVITPRGARTLLARAEADGVQNGIDWFMMRQAAHVTTRQAAPPLVTSPLSWPADGTDSDIQHDFTPLADTATPHRGAAVSTSTIRVKLMGHWSTPEALCREWSPMSQGGLRWNDIEVTWEDRDVDFYVVINAPPPGEFFVPARTIVFQMEPWCALPWQTWGVKTWGAWAKPDPAAFLQVRSHARFLNNAQWQFRTTHAELKTRTVEKTRLLSAICSSKYADPGQIARVDFLRYFEDRRDPATPIDIFGYDNVRGFRSYRGPLAPDAKDNGLAPYRYTFAAENNQEYNYITEKLWEPILTETLCFYAGCPNAAEHVDPRAYIPIDLSDFARASEVIADAIAAGEYERRIDAIRAEKTRVLEERQFFPTLERILCREFKMPAHATDDEVVYHKYFHALAGRTIHAAAFVFNDATSGVTSLRQVLDRIAGSGLAVRLDGIVVVNVGPEIRLASLAAGLDARVHVINYSPDATLGERPARDLLRRFALAHADSRLLYVGRLVNANVPLPAIDDHVEYLARLDVDRAIATDRGDERAMHDVPGIWWTRGRDVDARLNSQPVRQAV